MTEQQEYRVLNSHGNVELREYAPCVVADVIASGSAEQAGSAASRQNSAALVPSLPKTSEGWTMTKDSGNCRRWSSAAFLLR